MWLPPSSHERRVDLGPRQADLVHQLEEALLELAAGPCAAGVAFPERLQQGAAAGAARIAVKEVGDREAVVEA